MQNIKIPNLKKDRDIKEIRNLYIYSFPRVERIPFYFIMASTKKGLFTFTKYVHEDKFIGFTIVCKNETNRHFLFFAIKPEYRNQGYGAKILHHVMNESDLPMYLTAEYYPEGTPETDIRVRRINFYKRNGWKIIPTYLFEFKNKLFILGTEDKDIDCVSNLLPFKKIYGFVSLFIFNQFKLEKKED